MKDILIDPRDFIRPPYWNCHKCNAENSYGVLSIYESQYSRRCKSCMHTESYPLPKLEKKIIYIDQFVISNMMKSIDPAWNLQGTKKNDPFWIKMFEKLDILSKLQLIICPDTLTHYYESIVSPEYKKLKRLYELLSHGLSFYDFQTIERFTICLYFEEWLKGKSTSNLLLDKRNILHGNIHGWQERLLISVDFNNKQDMEKILQPINQENHQMIQELFCSWKQLKDFNFENQYRLEVSSYGETLIRQYQELMLKLHAYILHSNLFYSIAKCNNAIQK